MIRIRYSISWFVPMDILLYFWSSFAWKYITRSVIRAAKWCDPYSPHSLQEMKIFWLRSTIFYALCTGTYDWEADKSVLRSPHVSWKFARRFPFEAKWVRLDWFQKMAGADNEICASRCLRREDHAEPTGRLLFTFSESEGAKSQGFFSVLSKQFFHDVPSKHMLTRLCSRLAVRSDGNSFDILSKMAQIR